MRSAFSPRVPEFCTEEDLAVCRDPAYWKGRWSHYRQAAQILTKLCKEGPILEVGPYTCPLIRNAVCMDTMDHGIGAVRWDAGRPDWPFHRSAFSAVVALQIIEHLRSPDGQRTFFEEAARVARDVILISVPWKWNEDGDHGRIDDRVLAEWTLGTVPVESDSGTGVPGKLRRVLAYRSVDIRASFARRRKTDTTRTIVETCPKVRSSEDNDVPSET